MTRLAPDELKEIGIAAIRRVLGDTFTRVSADIGPDFEGRGAYFYTIFFSREADWRHASARQAEIARAIIDELDLREDEHFPFIAIASDGTWSFAHDAAAE